MRRKETTNVSTLHSISRYAERAAAQINHQYQWGNNVHNVEQEEIRVTYAERRNPYSNQERGYIHRVIGADSAEHSFCISPDYIVGGSEGFICDQMKARFSFFFSVLQSRKRAAEPIPKHTDHRRIA